MSTLSSVAAHCRVEEMRSLPAGEQSWYRGEGWEVSGVGGRSGQLPQPSSEARPVTDL